MESWTLTSGFLDSRFVTIQIADEHKQEGCNEVSELTSVPRTHALGTNRR